MNWNDAAFLASLHTKARAIPTNNVYAVKYRRIVVAIQLFSRAQEQSMREPTTAEEIAALHKILKSDPQRYLNIANGWIEQNPKSATAYFSRHQVWMNLGEPQRAIKDLDKSIELEPVAVSFWSRGDVNRHLGKYELAMDDYRRAEAIDPDKWERDAVPLLYQADVHARMGNEAAALDCCARLPDHFWTPGHNDLPPGGKAEIAEELRRRAATANARKRGP